MTIHVASFFLYKQFGQVGLGKLLIYKKKKLFLKRNDDKNMQTYPGFKDWNIPESTGNLY